MKVKIAFRRTKPRRGPLKADGRTVAVIQTVKRVGGRWEAWLECRAEDLGAACKVARDVQAA